MRASKLGLIVASVYMCVSLAVVAFITYAETVAWNLPDTPLVTLLMYVWGFVAVLTLGPPAAFWPALSLIGLETNDTFAHVFGVIAASASLYLVFALRPLGRLIYIPFLILLILASLAFRLIQ